MAGSPEGLRARGDKGQEEEEETERAEGGSREGDGPATKLDRNPEPEEGSKHSKLVKIASYQSVTSKRIYTQAFSVWVSLL